MSNDEVFLDLSNFEQRQQDRFDAQLIDEDELASSTEAWGEEPDLEQRIPDWMRDDQIDEVYSDQTLWKARELIDAELITEEERGRFVVQGSQPGSIYIVRITELDGFQVPWASCSCPNGQHRTNRPSCYHTAAAIGLFKGLDMSKYNEPVSRPRGRRR